MRYSRFYCLLACCMVLTSCTRNNTEPTAKFLSVLFTSHAALLNATKTPSAENDKNLKFFRMTHGRYFGNEMETFAKFDAIYKGELYWLFSQGPDRETYIWMVYKLPEGMPSTLQTKKDEKDKKKDEKDKEKEVDPKKPLVGCSQFMMSIETTYEGGLAYAYDTELPTISMGPWIQMDYSGEKLAIKKLSTKYINSFFTLIQHESGSIKARWQSDSSIARIKISRVRPVEPYAYVDLVPAEPTAYIKDALRKNVRYTFLKHTIKKSIKKKDEKEDTEKDKKDNKETKED